MKIRFFRVIDGVRVPFVMELDSTLTEVSTIREEPVVYPGAPVPVYASDPPRQDQEMLKWFVRSNPNPFPGTDALRAEFGRELDALTGSETGCQGCDIARLMERYRRALHATPHEQPQS